MGQIKEFFKDDLNAGFGWGILSIIFVLIPLPLFQNFLLGAMASSMGFNRNKKAISAGRKFGILGNILCSIPFVYICFVIVEIVL
ncbi:MAG: hypothetical protein WA152_00465 [Microgenomates group bacterium]